VEAAASESGNTAKTRRGGGVTESAKEANERRRR
jgi:hypothetical protein